MIQNDVISRTSLLSELNNGGHVTVTQQMLALLIFRAFCTRHLLRSDKKLRGNKCKTFLTYFHVSWYLRRILFDVGAGK